MLTFATEDHLSETKKRTFHCIYERVRRFDDPFVLGGLIITCIGLILGIIIIVIRKLHFASVKKSFFIVITMIIMIVGLALLISCAEVYEILISLPAATGLTILAIFMGIRLKDLETKFITILFLTFCLSTGIGFILFVIGMIFYDNVLQGDAWVCWGCATFVAIIFTTDYLQRKQFSKMYNIFLLFYEYFALNITSEFFVNSLMHCNWTNVNNVFELKQQLKEIMIRHDE
ncbi:unnamed protein product [Schistosoma margrebowiei]|uniref:Uncharacterized protein n=1 Tax=Schistosoma margrebowiei TaxID=48269 RepID=A0AA85AMQ6_9TREM|nr:unnamed protein product [Schistosoma margrebowiei]